MPWENPAGRVRMEVMVHSMAKPMVAIADELAADIEAELEAVCERIGELMKEK